MRYYTQYIYALIKYKYTADRSEYICVYVYTCICILQQQYMCTRVPHTPHMKYILRYIQNIFTFYIPFIKYCGLVAYRHYTS